MNINYFNISWISNEDGPGQRLVLFLQKCHLNCAWCHSPHSREEKSPLLFFPNLCIKCSSCVDICTSQVHSFDDGVHIIDRDKCKQCGDCITACPFSNEDEGTLMLPTKTVKVVDLYNKLRPQLLLLKEIGGITISGGEPLLQVDAVKELLQLCKKDGIHTALETSGINVINDYRIVSSLVDCWLLGFRLTTAKGKINESMYQAFSKSLAFLSKLPNTEIIGRIPIIPNYNTFNEYYNRVIDLLNSYWIKKVELLEYNQYTSHYYNAMGLPYNDEDILPLASEKFEQAKIFFETNKIEIHEKEIQFDD